MGAGVKSCGSVVSNCLRKILHIGTDASFNSLEARRDVLAGLGGQSEC